MTARDVQRSRVYSAEHVVERIYDTAARADCPTVTVHGSTLTLPVERRFASVESVQRYLDAVLALTWVLVAWPDRAGVPVAARERRGHTRAHYERVTATIAIPPYVHNRAWALREFVVLHELAHHLAPDPAAAAHGPEFVGRFAALVSELVGPEAGFLLTSTMRDNGVRIAADPPSGANQRPDIDRHAARATRSTATPDLCQHVEL